MIFSSVSCSLRTVNFATLLFCLPLFFTSAYNFTLIKTHLTRQEIGDVKGRKVTFTLLTSCNLFVPTPYSCFCSFLCLVVVSDLFMASPSLFFSFSFHGYSCFCFSFFTFLFYDYFTFCLNPTSHSFSYGFFLPYFFFPVHIIFFLSSFYLFLSSLFFHDITSTHYLFYIPAYLAIIVRP